MYEDRPALLKRAVEHFVKRLKSLPDDENIKTIISNFAKDELNKSISIMNELLDYFTKGQVDVVNDRIDRYRLPICLAITCYVADLNKYDEEVKNKLGDATPPNNIGKEIETFNELKEIFCKPKQQSYF
jgi:hypothetical protein